jgi:hypothetical protein
MRLPAETHNSPTPAKPKFSSQFSAQLTSNAIHSTKPIVCLSKPFQASQNNFRFAFVDQSTFCNEQPVVISSGFGFAIAPSSAIFISRYGTDGIRVFLVEFMLATKKSGDSTRVDGLAENCFNHVTVSADLVN